MPLNSGLDAFPKIGSYFCQKCLDFSNSG
jgi:hypothetical protein